MADSNNQPQYPTYYDYIQGTLEEVVAWYNADGITCYPGSNQTDDGKLNMEFNMARFVTRVSSKNFCIVKPSFDLTIISSQETASPQIMVSTGQASINGMDLIMTQTIVIDPPTEPGTYHLAFKLARNSQNNVEGTLVLDEEQTNDGIDRNNNVEGDYVYGETQIFEGVYLKYYTDKPDPMDPDMLYLGQVTWDGTEFSNIIEDEDKYGRIWAEDVLCKVEDWKHPEFRRLNLQQYVYKLPDWYVSKEGDVIFGAVEFLNGRKDGVEGTLLDHEDLGTGKYGVRLEAVDANTGKLIIKGPSTSTTDANKVITLEGNNTGTSITMGKSKIYQNTATNNDLYITSDNNIDTISQKKVIINGKTGVEISGGSNKTDPKLTLENHVATFSDSTATTLPVKIDWTTNTEAKLHIGNEVLRYNVNDKTFNLEEGTGSTVNQFNIYHKTHITKDVGLDTALYIGTGTIGQQLTYLKQKDWRVSESSTDYTNIKPHQIILANGSNNSSITKVSGTDKLQTSGTFEVGNNLIVTNSSYQKGNVYIGTAGTSAGAKVTINSSTGDITSLGDIRAKRVFNAVYNDFAEILQKDKQEIIEPGDVVCIKNDGLVYKVNESSDINKIIGICSDTAGLILGGQDLEEEEQVIVGFVGQIWVKTNELDIIPGTMLKANADGTVGICQDKKDKFAIALSTVINNKVKVLYNG